MLKVSKLMLTNVRWQIPRHKSLKTNTHSLLRHRRVPSINFVAQAFSSMIAPPPPTPSQSFQTPKLMWRKSTLRPYYVGERCGGHVRKFCHRWSLIFTNYPLLPPSTSSIDPPPYPTIKCHTDFRRFQCILCTSHTRTLRFRPGHNLATDESPSVTHHAMCNILVEDRFIIVYCRAKLIQRKES